MNTLKKITLILLISLCCSAVYSQSVNFSYDASGNRISRTITMASPLKSDTSSLETPSDVYSEELAGIQLNIYPNPTEGLLKVELRNLPEKQTADITLYNLSGRLIVTRKQVVDFTEIDISSQPAGIYLMKIRVGTQQVEWKIIKK